MVVLSFMKFQKKEEIKMISFIASAVNHGYKMYIRGKMYTSLVDTKGVYMKI